MNRRTVLAAAAAAAVTAAAAAGLPLRLRVVAAIATGAAVAVGLQWRAVPMTVTGLLAMLLAVATGPASDSGVLLLLPWVVPAWGLVMVAAAGHDRPRPLPAGRRVRLVARRGEVLACVGSLPLLVVAAGATGLPAGWATAGLLLFACLLAVAVLPARPRPDGPPTHTTDGRPEARVGRS